MNPGFYKLNQGTLLYAPNFVLNANYQLRAEAHEEYDYPVDGCYWFDSEADAYEYFGLPKPEELSSVES